jgi:hypothetical protein
MTQKPTKTAEFPVYDLNEYIQNTGEQFSGQCVRDSDKDTHLSSPSNLRFGNIKIIGPWRWRMSPTQYYSSVRSDITFPGLDPMDIRPAALYSETDGAMYMQSAVFLPALRALKKIYPALHFYFEFEAACRVHKLGWDDITGRTDFLMLASPEDNDEEQVPILLYEAKAPGAI